MLIGNYSILCKTPGRSFGTAHKDARSNFNTSGSSRGVYFSSNRFSFLNGIPNGYYPPYCWFIPQKAGGIASYTQTFGIGDIIFSNLAGGRNAFASLEGVGDITNAACGLIVSAVATISSSATFSASITGKLEASASLAGYGDIEGALGALADAVSQIIAGGGVVSTLTGKGHISANITPYTELSPENLASSVWNSLATAFNTSGTMGEKLNAAGTSSDPWTAQTSNYTTPGTFGKKLGSLDKDEIAKAVWDEPASSHTTTGTFGKIIQFIKNLILG